MSAIQQGDYFEYVEHSTTYTLAAFDTNENAILTILPAGTDGIYRLLNVNIFMHNITSKGTFRVYYSGKTITDPAYKRSIVGDRLDSGEITWDPANNQYWVPIYFQEVRYGAVKITWESLGGEPTTKAIEMKYVIGNRVINT